MALNQPLRPLPDSATGATQPQNDASGLAKHFRPTGNRRTQQQTSRDHVSALPEPYPHPRRRDLETLVRRRPKARARLQQVFTCQISCASRSPAARWIQSGNGNWKHRDSMAELLTYHDGHQKMETLEVKRQAQPVLSNAPQYAELHLANFSGRVRRPAPAWFLTHLPKTQFEWKEARDSGRRRGNRADPELSSGARENATLDLSESNNTIGVGFHGLIYIDASTSGIRRITVEADNLPRDFF